MLKLQSNNFTENFLPSSTGQYKLRRTLFSPLAVVNLGATIYLQAEISPCGILWVSSQMLVVG